MYGLKIVCAQSILEIVDSDTFTISTELYKEIDWITDFLPANSGQSGLMLQLNQLFKL